MLSAHSFIKYAIKHKLKTSVKYLNDLKSPLEESTVFWNAGEGLAVDLAIRTLKILNSTSPRSHYWEKQVSTQVWQQIYVDKDLCKPKRMVIMNSHEK